MMIKPYGGYMLRVIDNPMGDWTVYVHKPRDTEPIYTAFFDHNKVKANWEICLSKAVDEAKEIESENV